MKKELPPAALWIAIGLGVVLVGGLAYSQFAGGPGSMSNDEKIVAEKEAELARQRSQAYSSGQSAGGGPPGQGSSEFNARQQQGK